MVYIFPFNDSIPLLESFNNEVFKNIVTCGPESLSSHHIVVDHTHRWYGYKCVGGYIWVAETVKNVSWQRTSILRHVLGVGVKVS